MNLRSIFPPMPTAFKDGEVDPGAILAVACVRPALCLRLKAAVDEGHHAEALDIQQRLNPLARAVTTGFGIAGLKAAMDLSGLVGGDPRPPLAPLSPDAIERMRTLLHDTAD